MKVLLILFLSFQSLKSAPQNPIVEGLRALFKPSGRSIDGDKPGLNLSLLDNINIPENLIPDEFKFIRTGLCGKESTKKCFCEEGATNKVIAFPSSRDTVTFKGIKGIFANCRPM